MLYPLSSPAQFIPEWGTTLIDGKRDNKNTSIAIKDSGIGMNDKILENTFQLNAKTNKNTTKNEPSKGLGLVLCKEFIEKHGRKIWIESKENKGFTFYFSFPHAMS